VIPGGYVAGITGQIKNGGVFLGNGMPVHVVVLFSEMPCGILQSVRVAPYTPRKIVEVITCLLPDLIFSFVLR